MLQKSAARSTRFLGLAIAITLIAAGASFGIRKVCAQSTPHKVIAYYFHTNTRCDTCRKIEAYTHEAIEEGFKTELNSGTLELRVVNYEERENRHYIKEYQLVSKSLILVNMVDGKQTEWMNLKLVWELVKNKQAFLNYVRGEVRNYLSKS
jgi:hypothetical protein